MKLKMTKLMVPFLIATMLAACGGGSGDNLEQDDRPAQAGLRLSHASSSPSVGSPQTPSNEAPSPSVTAENNAAPNAEGAATPPVASLDSAGSPQSGQMLAEELLVTSITASRPFPHHTTYTAGVIKPSNVSQSTMDSKVNSYYSAWKTNYLRTSGGQGTWVKYDDTNSTVSEAHGYGMVIAAYMADKSTFDSMYHYFKAHPSVNASHLMAWKQTLSGSTMKNVEGSDSATDGDLDIAYALLLADAQWGSGGSINYRAQALSVMHDILSHDVNTSHWNLTPGDWATGSDANHTRPSDFMTDHFLVFAKVDTANASKWNSIYDTTSKIVNYQFAHGSGSTGIVPDFMVWSGTKSNFVPVSGTYLESKHDGDFDYNACRTPWRLAMSYIVNGKTDMLAAQQKTTDWIKAKTNGKPSNIRGGYYIKNGTNGNSYVSYDDLAFTAPMAVNAMLGGSDAQSWLNSLWTSITGGDYGTKVDYYGDTIRMQVLITVSGNWWVP
jgi:endoglucanase